jgi:predicted helicase
VHGKNASQGHAKLKANTGSFDSVNGLASESAHSAQDDRVELAQDDRAGVGSNLDIFRAFARAGKRLAEIHVPLRTTTRIPDHQAREEGEKLDYRVTKMRLNKDKTMLTYNQFLTLTGIPTEIYEYRLGNRSALEWVIDQYQVSTDKRSGTTNDTNRGNDPTYILRLIGQVVTVSLETVKIVQGLPPLGLEATARAAI